jgi:alkylhydroperoxidase/carboxymuconolactone decarboxylase family protein YurZ
MNNLIPLISAAAVLRKEKMLKQFLMEASAEKLSRRKIYEALLQTYLFAGFPSALISLQIFNEIFPSKKTPKNIIISDMHIEGVKNCKKIYGKKFDKLVYNIKEFSPELSEWLVTEGYGKVFSRKGISIKEREKSIIAVLSALKFESQLYSHINGAYRLGISIEEIESIINNLDRLNDSSFRSFGIKILKKFKEKKVAASEFL